MKRSGVPTLAFSLIEVTLTIGIAGFSLIAILGLLPVGVQTHRSATSQTASTNIIASVTADMRAAPSSSSTSPQYGIRFGTNKTLYFDSAGQFTTSLTANSRYLVNVTFPPNPPTGLSYADIKITWPAAAAPENALGTMETFAAFDRN